MAETKKDDEIEVTPEMIEAGIDALQPYLFEGYQVFPSDHQAIVEAVWAAMNKAAVAGVWRKIDNLPVLDANVQKRPQ